MNWPHRAAITFADCGVRAGPATAVQHSQTIGPPSSRTLIPRSRLQVWRRPQAIRLLPRLPAGLRRLTSFEAVPPRC